MGVDTITWQRFSPRVEFGSSPTWSQFGVGFLGDLKPRITSSMWLHGTLILPSPTLHFQCWESNPYIAPHVLGKSSTIELYPQPFGSILIDCSRSSTSPLAGRNKATLNVFSLTSLAVDMLVPGQTSINTCWEKLMLHLS